LYPSNIARLHLHAKTKAHFTLGVKANVQLKSSIPIGAKVEISPKGFQLGVKAEIEKIFSICPKLVINAEFYGLLLATKAEKRIPSNLRSQFATLGANVINT
jgi:hypothetical protein